MKFCLDKDEWYPVYNLMDARADGRHTIEVTEEEYSRIQNAFEEFDAVQVLLREKAKGK